MKGKISIFVASGTLLMGMFFLPVQGSEANRLAHLDEPNNPWQFDQHSAKLITPQWIGEDAPSVLPVTGQNRITRTCSGSLNRESLWRLTQ
jgi:hypothetical protein